MERGVACCHHCSGSPRGPPAISSLSRLSGLFLPPFADITLARCCGHNYCTMVAGPKSVCPWPVRCGRPTLPLTHFFSPIFQVLASACVAWATSTWNSGGPCFAAANFSFATAAEKSVRACVRAPGRGPDDVWVPFAYTPPPPFPRHFSPLVLCFWPLTPPLAILTLSLLQLPLRPTQG